MKGMMVGEGTAVTEKGEKGEGGREVEEDEAEEVGGGFPVGAASRPRAWPCAACWR